MPLATDAQPFTPLGTPPLQNQLAALGRHAFPETVRLFSFGVIGLKRSFHYNGISTCRLGLNLKT
jgi:hypothetical protein